MALELYTGDIEPSLAIPATALAAWFLYLVSLVVYRLYLSPLSKFPGPKLAALTKWYEAYYEIILQGQYSRKIDELHDVYGPIVRVTPDELHIRDSDFFDDVYAKNPRVAKIGWDTRFGSRASTFTTPNAALHRRRRAAFSSMFSRRAILDFQPIVRRHVDIFMKRIEGFAGTGKPIVFSEAFPALTGDIIMEYSFGFSYHQLEHPQFDSFHEAFMAIGSSGHIASQFPWFFALMNSIPDSIVEKSQPALGSLLKLKKDQWDLVARTIRGEDLSVKNDHRTIFHEIVQSKLPPEDKTQQRLADEAQTVVGAGVETTAFTLTVGTFHIINTPRIFQRLRKELTDAFPDSTAFPELLEFEKLPYLKACIQESLRLSHGLSARNPRAHDRPLQYRQWTIPPNTVIGMTIPDVHHDEAIFPSSHSFIPERWLDDPRTADGTPLDHYLVAFGRGPRSCLGINLAWSELLLTVGLMFRRFDFQLFETDETDVKVAHDFFIPNVKMDSKGVRASVTNVH